MTHAFRTLSALALVAPLLAACAGSGDRYPSLAIRDVERTGPVVEPAPPVEPVALPIQPVVPSDNIPVLVAQANDSHRTFLARVPSARQLASAARASGRDSDARGRATVALADLTSLRSQTEIPLGDLDLLVAERTNRLEPAEEALAAHAQVLALVEQQDRTLDELWGLIGL